MPKGVASILAAIAFMLFIPVWVMADDRFCQYSDLGFSFSIPNDWTEVSAGEIARLQSLFQNKPVQCIDAYQPSANGAVVRYPYLLVELIHYSRNQTPVEISEDDLKLVAAKLSGTDLEKLVPATNQVSVSSAGSATYQVNPPGCQWTSTVNVQGVGQANVWSLCRLGSDEAIQLCVYSRPGDESVIQPAMQSISGSFNFAAGRVAVVKPSMSIWDSASLGGIGGAVLGAIGYMLRKKRSTTSGPTPKP
jgi:hypothetical protein